MLNEGKRREGLLRGLCIFLTSLSHCAVCNMHAIQMEKDRQEFLTDAIKSMTGLQHV